MEKSEKISESELLRKDYKEKEQAIISDFAKGKINGIEFRSKINSLKRKEHLYKMMSTVRNV